MAVALLDDLTPVAVPISCRSWACPRCAPRLKRRLLSRLKTSRPNLFVTLTTSHRTAPTPEAAFDIASKAFGHLIKRWRYWYPGARIEYFLVWEKTKAGWPHIHALLEAPRISKHRLSHTWNELTRSYIVDIQDLPNTQHAIAYVSKYLTKDPAVPPGHRRWRRSAGMFRFHEPGELAQLPRLSKWRLLHRSEEAICLTFLLHGMAINRTPSGIIHARDDPELYAKQVTQHDLEKLLHNLGERDRETVTDWPFYDRRRSQHLGHSEVGGSRP